MKIPRSIRRTLLVVLALFAAGNLVLQIPKWIAMRQISVLRQGGTMVLSNGTKFHVDQGNLEKTQFTIKSQSFSEYLRGECCFDVKTSDGGSSVTEMLAVKRTQIVRKDTLFACGVAPIESK